MDKKTALVIGATGLIGKQLVSLLLERQEYDQITVLVRRSIDIEHPKLEERMINFDELGADDIPEVDDVYCALGTTIKKAKTKEAFRKVDYEYPLLVARLAKEKGAAQYVIVTAMGSSSMSSFFYSRVKGELEEALQEVGYKALKIFRPSLLLGERSEFRLGERMAEYMMRLFRFVMIGPLKRYRAVEGKQVAKAMMIEANRKSDANVSIYESQQIFAIAQGSDSFVH
ncbi:NAD(P)H-binding protein [Halalkalibacterium ligniniphilum]|uniref:NAD(P)H-binding protein n=1 Tax=Halalkalibacterium ligniniphilum TaxID=1134413 RepID=UPI00034C9A38|nr:NAD(P)H-binding protein [Halalkalibacterium ligniniphilum]